MVCMALAGKSEKIVNARDMGVVACTRCSKAWPLGATICGRCGKALVSRDQLSLHRVWAFWVMGVACYIPANVLPMLNTKTLFLNKALPGASPAVRVRAPGLIGGPPPPLRGLIGGAFLEAVAHGAYATKLPLH